jgi:hypothetical protein
MNDFRREITTATRWEKKRQRLGFPDPHCAVCEMNDIRSLARIAGSADREGIVLCSNDRKKARPMREPTRQKRLRLFARAGYVDPSCLLCGERDLRTLELHHLCGEANSSFVVPLCRNCHDVVSDGQEAFGFLRLRDINRRPLVLQAAFDVGLGLIAGSMAVCAPDTTRQVCWGLAAAVLVAWAVWNLAADNHFADLYGADYSSGVPAPVPT